MDSDSELSSTSSIANPFVRESGDQQAQEDIQQNRVLQVHESGDNVVTKRGTKRKASNSLEVEVSNNPGTLLSHAEEAVDFLPKISPVIAAENTKLAAPIATRKSSRKVPQKITLQKPKSPTAAISKSPSPPFISVKEGPSWADPKSADWDIMRVLQDESFIKQTWLTEKVNHQYLTSGGNLRTKPEYHYWEHQTMPRATHPDYIRHVGKRTDNWANERYFRHLDHGIKLPLAGLPSDDPEGEAETDDFETGGAEVFAVAADQEAAIVGQDKEVLTKFTTEVRASERPSIAEGGPATKVRRTTRQMKTVEKIAKEVPIAATIAEDAITNTKKVSLDSTFLNSDPEKSASNETTDERPAFYKLTTDQSTGNRSIPKLKLINKTRLRALASSEEVIAESSSNQNQNQNQMLTKDAAKEESFHTKPSIKLHVPDHIKAILVDDWENVTKNQQLVPIPAKHSVTMILNDYLAYEKPNRVPGSALEDILEEVVSGLKVYFERCLGRILLYRFERNQYVEALDAWNSTKGELAGKTAADTYGAEHLARLLVTLPELIAQTNMDQPSVNRLRVELTAFTSWLGRNATTYFVSEYETPSAEYVDKARGVY